MRGKNGTSRPPATEAQIREMHDRAQGHAQRAAEHEAQALSLTTEAEQHANAYVEQAQATAAEMVRQAKAQADNDVRDAHMAAQKIRDERDAETRGHQYWASLAADEAVAAGLPPVPPTAPLETVPDGEAASNG
jgi:hypothetical protein